MEQFPLRGPVDGVISIAPLCHTCSRGAMEIAALVPNACNEIAPFSGSRNGNCSIVEL